LVGGGTGGHLQPGLVLRDALLRRHPDWKVAFLVAGREIEQEFLSAEVQQAALFPGQASRPALWRADLYCGALWRVKRTLKAFRPDLLVLLGGYVSAITTLGALGVPFVLLEPNRVPGKAARLAAPMARRVFLQWPLQRGARIPASKARWTGMPVSLTSLSSRSDARKKLGLDPDLPTLLVLGGSQGAQSINQGLFSGLASLEGRAELQIIHVTGPRHQEQARQAYARFAGPSRVLGFSTHMADLYAAADLIVGRSGGMTVAEIAAAGRAALFVPFPFHKDQHQLENARVLADAGAAWIVLQDQLGEDFVTRELLPRLRDPLELHHRGEIAATLGKRDATLRIVQELERLLEWRNPERQMAGEVQLWPSGS
jgi:UDP-N-acetylglucosamine--N-acetylmuramyl-(pentapeptide) pyrophosphoryl-undecaprenol N-acetylglucosamine transferase